MIPCYRKAIKIKIGHNVKKKIIILQIHIIYNYDNNMIVILLLKCFKFVPRITLI